VLLGGATSPLGGLAGIVALGLLTRVTSVGALAGEVESRLQTLFASLILLTLLGLGVRGLVPWLAGLRARRDPVRPEPSLRPRAAPNGLADPSPLVQAHGLTKRFGVVTAVDGVDMELTRGAVHALVGPNGSGKTTVLKLLTGALVPDGGSIALDGRRLDGDLVRRRALRGIVGTLQSTAVFDDSTVLQNALVGAGLRRRYGGAFRTLLATPLHRRESREVGARARAALDVVGLGWAEGVPAGRLSGFDQRLLMIATAAATSPSALLLDEPAAGAGPHDLERLHAVLERLRSDGLALLLVEHNLRLVTAIADRVTVLVNGAVVDSGNPAFVLASPAVRAAYLGTRRVY
jgi:ABC-type branched-subunit amino acid transport system ATPase component